MAVPLATTTITVLRAPVADLYAEPYSDTRTADLVEVATKVRAVIDVAPRGAGTEVAAGGEQTVTELRLICDVCNLTNVDYVRDERTGVTYRITWCFEYPGEHIEGGLKLVEGLV